jgi:hypothetical protein
VLAAALAATLVAAMALQPAIGAQGKAAGDSKAPPQISTAKVQTGKEFLQAKLVANGLVPTDGSKGALGYGLLTSKGLDGIIVTTTHAGVMDSAMQASASDPAWHNHFVKLQAAGDVCNPNTALGGARLEVQDLTFQSPGKVKVQGRMVDLQSMPSKFTGTSSLTGNPLTIAPGNDVTATVSFGLRPVFGPDGALQHVCVENVAQKEIPKK